MKKDLSKICQNYKKNIKKVLSWKPVTYTTYNNMFIIGKKILSD